MKLYDVQGNFRGRKIQLVAAYLDIPLEISHVKPTALTQKEFQKKNPYGKVPVLETNEGFIYESNAIIRFLARLHKEAQLTGCTPYEEGLVDQWLEVCCLEIEPAILALALPVLGWAAPFGDKEQIWGDIKKNLQILDLHLKFRTFFVGNRATLADLAIASVLYLGFLFLFERKLRETYPNLTRWFNLISDQSPFIHVFGKVKFCEKEFPPSDLKADEKADKADKKEKKEKKDVKEEGNAKAKTEKPKETKKESSSKNQTSKEAPKKQEDKKEEDDEEKPVKKDKNPLDLLPPSNFNFYDFKTLFVNAQNKKEALDYFWKNFDANGYSIWFVKYQKAPGEGKNLIFTNNLMGGFLNRLEDFRKYSFAVHGVYGEEPNLEIRGCWVWRGLEHPGEIKDLPNYEYHTFERCDLQKPEHRSLVEQYWTGLNEGDIVEGLKAQTVKYFK